MHYFVTGATGFIGKRLVKTLLARRGATVHFLLRPEIAARNTNLIKYTNGDTPTPAINDALRNDPSVYPPPEVLAKLHAEPTRTPEYTRLLTRTWTRFKTGK